MQLFGTRRNPLGPEESNKVTCQFLLSGTRVSLELPEGNDPVHKGYVETEFSNLYEKSQYGVRWDYKEQSLFEKGLLKQKYLYYQSSLLGKRKVGEMTAELSVAYMPQFQSLFRPRRFECAVERYIFSSYVYAFSGFNRKNYQRVHLNGNVWSNFRCDYYDSCDDYQNYQDVWLLPISECHILSLYFTKLSREGNQYLLDKQKSLIENVNSSLVVELSGSAKEEQEAAENEHPYESFSESLPPYEFELYKPIEEYDLTDIISEKHNHEIELLPEGQFSREVDEALEVEEEKRKASLQKLLQSHLRFEELEAEDYARYIKEKESTASSALGG